jgi:hypothetical protein
MHHPDCPALRKGTPSNCTCGVTRAMDSLREWANRPENYETHQPTPVLRWAVRKGQPWPERVLQQKFLVQNCGTGEIHEEWRGVPVVEVA